MLFRSFSLAFLFQYAIGAIIDLYPPVGVGYAPDAYRLAFGAVLVAEVAALLWFLAGWRGPHPQSLRPQARGAGWRAVRGCLAGSFRLGN